MHRQRRPPNSYEAPFYSKASTHTAMSSNHSSAHVITGMPGLLATVTIPRFTLNTARVRVWSVMRSAARLRLRHLDPDNAHGVRAHLPGEPQLEGQLPHRPSDRASPAAVGHVGPRTMDAIGRGDRRFGEVSEGDQRSTPFIDRCPSSY